MLKRSIPYFILFTVDYVLLYWWFSGVTYRDPAGSLAIIIFAPAIFIANIILTILTIPINKNLTKKFFINSFAFTFMYIVKFFAAMESPTSSVDADRAELQALLPFQLPDSLQYDLILRQPEERIYHRDFNFDGRLDIAILLSSSTDGAVLETGVWLDLPKGWKYIPAIREIGTPVLLENRKIVRGFWSCCCNSEIKIIDYRWNNYKLEKISKTHIENYPLGNKVVTDSIWSQNGVNVRVYAPPAGLVDSLIEEVSLQEW